MMIARKDLVHNRSVLNVGITGLRKVILIAILAINIIWIMVIELKQGKS